MSEVAVHDRWPASGRFRLDADNDPAITFTSDELKIHGAGRAPQRPRSIERTGVMSETRRLP